MTSRIPRFEEQLMLPFPEGLPVSIAPNKLNIIRNPIEIRPEYHRQTDALYVRFADDPVAETAEVRPGVMFDYGADGRIVAMKFLDASKTVAAGDVILSRKPTSWDGLFALYDTTEVPEDFMASRG